jgi:hypothetical protein
VKFEEIIRKCLVEAENFSEEKREEPWTIEITKDPNKSKEYNLIGELIIQLASLRTKMN